LKGGFVDFYKIRVKEGKGIPQAYPDWIVDTFDDLMIRGGSFYAVWDEEAGMWSRDEYDVRRLVDIDLFAYIAEAKRRWHYSRAVGNEKLRHWQLGKVQ
jgi:hypothetical protein